MRTHAHHLRGMYTRKAGRSIACFAALCWQTHGHPQEALEREARQRQQLRRHRHTLALKASVQEGRACRQRESVAVVSRLHSSNFGPLVSWGLTGRCGLYPRGPQALQGATVPGEESLFKLALALFRAREQPAMEGRRYSWVYPWQELFALGGLWGACGARGEVRTVSVRLPGGSADVCAHWRSSHWRTLQPNNTSFGTAPAALLNHPQPQYSAVRRRVPARSRGLSRPAGRRRVSDTRLLV